jgi:hypothetical protein
VTRIGKIDTITLTGASGRAYELRVYVWDTRFKALPAVYVVMSRTIEPNDPPRYEPLYVDATPNLSKALADHPRAECFQLYYANTVAVIKATDSEERARIAADLTAGLRPLCNGEEPDWRP